MAHLVTTQRQVFENIARLKKYSLSENSAQSDFYKNLIKKGRKFVVLKHDHSYVFAPSRFVGYRSNSMRIHQQSNEKDGRNTNAVLNKLFGMFLIEENVGFQTANRKFFELCSHLQIEPDDHPRGYWLINAREGIVGRKIKASEPFDAIDDYQDSGNHKPVKRSVQRYPRDTRVRNAVIRRSKGRCEFCGELGFKSNDNGRPYLESHHIIALANEGKDRITNVIALCPKHHREAHFGKRSNKLEEEMMKIVQSFYNA